MQSFRGGLFVPRRWFVPILVNFLFASVVLGQQTPVLPDAPTVNQSQSGQSSSAQSRDAQRDQQHEPSKNHILWIIPNYRSDENPANIKPLTPREKMKVAFDDSFDPSAFLVAGIFAGISRLQNQYPSFGTGGQGFAKYYGGAFADQAIGNIMTEGLFPIALHQDPRYFVKGTGGFWRRTGYAVSREFITRGDDGGSHFNTSELAGNAVAAGISNLYYPAADRSFGNTANKWGQQIGLDTFFNVTKEFWPDVRHKLFKRSSPQTAVDPLPQATK
jgi:hypothetical protein